MRQLSSLERLFLRVEKAAYPMDGCGVFVLDPVDGEPLTFERVSAELERRVRGIPVFTLRVVEPLLGLATEQWVVDPGFAIDRHLHHVALPAPGTLDELRDLVLALTQSTLDRSRPLWDAWFVEGLEDGRSALLLRMHHALIDGMGGMQMLGELFDLQPDPPEPLDDAVVAPEELERVPSSVELLVRSLPELASAPIRATQKTVDVLRATVLRNPRPLLRVRPRRSEGGSSGPPRSLFNRPVRSPEKSFAFLSLPLDDVRAVRRAFDVSVNDVFLAIVSVGVRRYLQERGALPDRPLRATCPMNVRIDSDRVGVGNKFAMLFANLPTDEADPVAAMLRIAEEMQQRKAAERSRTGTINVTETITDIPHPLVWELVGELLASPYSGVIPPVMNLVASNMYGPPVPLYFAGSRITHFYGRTMIMSGVGLFVHCISYDGSLEFGFTALRELVPDPDRIAELVRQALAELVDARPHRE